MAAADPGRLPPWLCRRAVGCTALRRGLPSGALPAARWRGLVLGLAALAGCAPAPEVFTGYIEGELVVVSAPLGGVLETLAVTRGARVDRGAELFRLDADVEALARAEAAARQAQAQALAADLGKGRRPAEIDALEQQLAAAAAAARAALAELTRQRELVARGFVSAARLDEVQAVAERDAARVRELQAQLRNARDAARPDEVAAAAAAAAAARAATAQSAWREDQKRQRAPASGVVFDTPYRVGERVPAGAPVVVLLPDGALKLRFYVPQAALPRLSVGGSVNVRCDGCPAGMTAAVRYIAAQAEYTPPVIYSNESRQKLVFLVEAVPAAAALAALKPGQPVDVSLGP